ncbi:MAG TPA: permease prefix domain 1-containing protein [Streptosporangiaceae bacterium]|nr:permease prefix domain 1-containing protein [Streptosporangiaceae bacterium]
MTGVVGMTGAARDPIAGYLAELGAGLRVPTADAELILAEAEDHLCETAAAGLAAGMTELEAQQAAITSFGPVRAVVRAHRRRIVTVRDAAMAAWKLARLLATTVGAGGLAGLGIFAYMMRSAPPGSPAGSVPAGTPIGKVVCPYSCYMVGPAGPNPVQTALLVYAALAAGGVALLVTGWLARRGTRSRDLLSPAVTASCFLLASALLAALVVSGVAVLVGQAGASWTTPVSEGSVSTVPLVPGAVVAACLAANVGFALQAALRLVRARTRARCARPAGFWVRLIAAV